MTLWTLSTKYPAHTGGNQGLIYCQTLTINRHAHMCGERRVRAPTLRKFAQSRPHGRRVKGRPSETTQICVVTPTRAESKGKASIDALPPVWSRPHGWGMQVVTLHKIKRESRPHGLGIKGRIHYQTLVMNRSHTHTGGESKRRVFTNVW